MSLVVDRCINKYLDKSFVAKSCESFVGHQLTSNSIFSSKIKFTLYDKQPSSALMSKYNVPDTIQENPSNCTTGNSTNFDARKVVGLINRNSCCYANAVIQCLIRISKFRKWIFSISECSLRDIAKFCALCSLRKVFDQMIKSKGRCVYAQSIVDNIAQLNRAFRIHEESDASEFMSHLLDKIQTDLKKEHNLAHNSALHDLHDIFSSALKSEVRCCGCNKVNVRCEIHQVIYLPWTKSPSVLDCLKWFMKTNVIEGYNCSKCTMKKAVETRNFHRLPYVLTLCLPRSVEANTKLHDRFSCPKVLDVSPYVYDRSSQCCQYELKSAIMHIGNYSTFGHYIAAVNTGGNHWMYINDDTASPVAERTILRSREAFVLIYVLQDPHSQSKQAIQDLSELTCSVESPNTDSSDSKGDSFRRKEIYKQSSMSPKAKDSETTSSRVTSTDDSGTSDLESKHLELPSISLVKRKIEHITAFNDQRSCSVGHPQKNFFCIMRDQTSERDAYNDEFDAPRRSRKKPRYSNRRTIDAFHKRTHRF